MESTLARRLVARRSKRLASLFAAAAFGEIYRLKMWLQRRRPSGPGDIVLDPPSRGDSILVRQVLI